MSDREGIFYGPEDIERTIWDTLASENPTNFSASTLVGLASSVISVSELTDQWVPMASMTAPTLDGDINEGVPPPKKMLSTDRGPVWAA